MTQAQKCLELLDTKLWLIEFEIRETEVDKNKMQQLTLKYHKLTVLRIKLIKRYNLKA